MEGEKEIEESQGKSGPDFVEILQQLDAKWEKRFDSLESRWRKRSRESEDRDSHSGGKKVCLGGGTEQSSMSACDDSDTDNNPDVLILQDEGKLDDEEDKLCAGPSDESKNKEEDSLIKQIEDDFNEEEQLGEKVREDLAKLTNGRFRSKLGEENLKKRIEAHKRPANCPALVVPTVNREIWTQIPQHAKRADLKLASIQRALTKSATAVVELVNELAPLPGQSERVRKGTDAIAMMGHASHELSLRRRSALKPFVNKTISRMCDESAGVPVTDKLF